METNKRKIIKKKTTQRAQRNKSKATAQVTLIKIITYLFRYTNTYAHTHTQAYRHNHTYTTHEETNYIRV